MQDNPLVVHLIYQLDVGGLERVMLNCIKHMQHHERYRHVVISLTNATPFAQSELLKPIEIFQLNKKEGNDFSLHAKLFNLFRQLKPAILHTYNLATIEYHPVAWLAGVKAHIHAEHGRDINDPQGLNVKHKWLRKLMSPFIQQFIPVSKDLSVWLTDFVGIPKDKVVHIANGINTDKFQATKSRASRLRLAIIARLSPVKDHKNLIDAMAYLLKQVRPENMPKLNIIGDGPLHQELVNYSENFGLKEHVLFLGERNDIVELLAETDVFVLSSVAEGIPMTILEAMSCSTPIVSTNVGGIPEVITDGVHGRLVEKKNPEQLGTAILEYINKPELIEAESQKARQRIIDDFSETHMVKQYLSNYNRLCSKGTM